MNSHATGPIRGTRLGCEVVTHTIPFTFSDLTAIAKKLLTISPILNPSPGVAVFEPEMFTVDVVIETQFNPGTSETLNVGTTPATYVDSINAFNLVQAIGTNATRAANPIKLVLADTDVFAIPTIVGAQPTAGKAHVIITVWGVNINEPTNQGG